MNHTPADEMTFWRVVCRKSPMGLRYRDFPQTGSQIVISSGRARVVEEVPPVCPGCIELFRPPHMEQKHCRPPCPHTASRKALWLLASGDDMSTLTDFYIDMAAATFDALIEGVTWLVRLGARPR
jgi:hypothetical protein